MGGFGSLSGICRGILVWNPRSSAAAVASVCLWPINSSSPFGSSFRMNLDVEMEKKRYKRKLLIGKIGDDFSIFLLFFQILLAVGPKGDG